MNISRLFASEFRVSRGTLLDCSNGSSFVTHHRFGSVPELNFFWKHVGLCKKTTNQSSFGIGWSNQPLLLQSSKSTSFVKSRPILTFSSSFGSPKYPLTFLKARYLIIDFRFLISANQEGAETEYAFEFCFVIFASFTLVDSRSSASR